MLDIFTAAGARSSAARKLAIWSMSRSGSAAVIRSAFACAFDAVGESPADAKRLLACRTGQTQILNRPIDVQPRIDPAVLAEPVMSGLKHAHRRLCRRRLREAQHLRTVEGFVLGDVAAHEQRLHPFRQLGARHPSVVIHIERHQPRHHRFRPRLALSPALHRLGDPEHTDFAALHRLRQHRLRGERDHGPERNERDQHQGIWSHDSAPLYLLPVRYWNGSENRGSLRNF